MGRGEPIRTRALGGDLIGIPQIVPAASIQSGTFSIPVMGDSVAHYVVTMYAANSAGHFPGGRARFPDSHQRPERVSAELRRFGRFRIHCA